MKLRGSEKNKFYNLITIIVTVFLMIACFITFLIDIDNNKGIIPLIFFLLMIYSILTFLYYILYSYDLTRNYKKKISFKVSYLFFFFINLAFFFISFLSLWN